LLEKNLAQDLPKEVVLLADAEFDVRKVVEGFLKIIRK